MAHRSLRPSTKTKSRSQQNKINWWSCQSPLCDSVKWMNAYAPVRVSIHIKWALAVLQQTSASLINPVSCMAVILVCSRKKYENDQPECQSALWLKMLMCVSTTYLLYVIFQVLCTACLLSRLFCSLSPCHSVVCYPTLPCRADRWSKMCA